MSTAAAVTGSCTKSAPDGKVNELCTLPNGSIPNGVTMDRQGNLVYCDLGKQAMMRVTQSGQVSMIADRVETLALTLPNFASYDAEGNLYVSNSSTRDIKTALAEMAKPEPNGALVPIRPDGRSEIVATDIYLANGTAIDPKEEAVYVLESTRNDCLRIAIKKDGTFGKPEIYSKDFPALPDGMAFATDGTLFVTLPAFNPAGKMAPAHQIIQVDTNGKWTTLIDDAGGRSSISRRTAPLAGRGCRTCTSPTWKANTSAGCIRPSTGIHSIINGKRGRGASLARQAKNPLPAARKSLRKVTFMASEQGCSSYGPTSHRSTRSSSTNGTTRNIFRSC